MSLWDENVRQLSLTELDSLREALSKKYAEVNTEMDRRLRTMHEGDWKR